MLNDEPDIRTVRLSPSDAGDKITLDADGRISIRTPERVGCAHAPNQQPAKDPSSTADESLREVLRLVQKADAGEHQQAIITAFVLGFDMGQERNLQGRPSS